MTDENTTTTESVTPPPMPGPLEFMLRTPLYDEFAVPSLEALEALYDFNSRFDAFCIYCKRASIFYREPVGTSTSTKISRAMNAPPLGWRRVAVVCTRNATHKYEFWFFVRDPGVILKAGQLPSIADLHVADIRQYRKLLGPDRIRELSRADGLASHGVGIGSFVYLRRIFESLIDEARMRAVETPGFDRSVFDASPRMDDRILLLRDFLPDFLVENRALYGILSKGIHELTEQECLSHYAVVRTGIEIILDEHLEAAAREERLANASRAIAAARARIQGG